MINLKNLRNKKCNFLISPLFILLFTGCSENQNTPIPNQKHMLDIIIIISSVVF